MVPPFLFVLSSLSLLALAYPERSQEQEGVRIDAPPRPPNYDSLPIPDTEHPFHPPGPDDIRGPCPGLNTLANHGYIPRNGAASFEQIVTATTHAFNMDYTLSSAITAFGMLARGNAYINKISIGLESPHVGPLPGNIDGPAARGLGSHGRFEGDVSTTRQDANIGDNINVNPDIYNRLLNFAAKFGDDSEVTGPKSIVNMRVMQEFRYQRFKDSQAANKKLDYHVGRLLLSYGEAAFMLNFMANGTDEKLAVPTMNSFFRDETFPTHWYKRQGPGDLNKIGLDVVKVYLAHPILPGANNDNGAYVPNGLPGVCALYHNLAGDNLPGVLLTTTGLLKRNVDFLLQIIHRLFPACLPAVPHGAANV